MNYKNPTDHIQREKDNVEFLEYEFCYLVIRVNFFYAFTKTTAVLT